MVGPHAWPLVLHPLSDAADRPLTVPPGGSAAIGRALQCELCLPVAEVSRRHAVISGRGGSWYILDEGSRSGTFINGTRAGAGQAVRIGAGDLVHIGPCPFRASIGQAQHTMTLQGPSVPANEVRAAPSSADRRLSALIECMGGLAAARDEHALAAAALGTLLDQAGFARGAVLRHVGRAGSVEVVADRRKDPADNAPLAFSRSLVERAAAGVVSIADDAPARDYGQSVGELRIHSALCAPILLGGAVDGFLYLDARGGETSVHGDVTGFCDAVAKAYGLALAELKRADLERRQREMHAELEAARDAQQFILPPPAGAVGSARYAMRMQAGLFVAGDLFDAAPMSGGRAAFALGDVAGHGVSSGMLMAATQAHLSALVSGGRDPGDTLTDLNRYLAPRSSGGRFASLWLGVIAPGGVLRYADAGHGHWAVWRRTDRVCTPGRAGGIPLGISPDAAYQTEALTLGPGDRVILYSDGMAEQRDARTGQEIGRDRLLSVVGGATPDDDVLAMFRLTSGASGGAALADDATAASVEFAPL
ncbi:MAG: SpoIIE family protein phosphatase [Phycisphaerales bacterium]|nr:SpoIIE family protein phosphatase [Phycisphaerales bacterium]